MAGLAQGAPLGLVCVIAAAVVLLLLQSLLDRHGTCGR